MDDLRTRVERALSRLDICDAYLLQNDAHERSIAHRFAIYLQAEFPAYDVDCEYNLNCANKRFRKELHEVAERFRELEKCIKKRHVRDIDGVHYYAISVLPDVIVHRRNQNNQNLLIVEMKKQSNREERDYDEFKLEKYTADSTDNEFRYRYGALVDLSVGETPSHHDITYYKDGHKVATSH